MEYSQTKLLELMAAGRIPGESGTPKRTETVISNVFLFNDFVYKVYKNNNEFFNTRFQDISTRGKRFAFSKADFEWNQQLSKEIYLRLQGVQVEDDNLIFVDKTDRAEELVLVTKRMPYGAVLFDQLQKGDLSEDDFYEIGKQFAEREKKFEWNGVFPNESLFENMISRQQDLMEWLKDTEEHLPASECKKYGEQLKDLIKRVYSDTKEKISIGLDFHSFNAFYLDKTLYPFDTYPPKDSWRFAAPLIDIYRLAADIYALTGEKEFQTVLRGYFDYVKAPQPRGDAERLLVMYATLIMVSYLYMLARTDTDKVGAADKYLAFLRRYVVE